MAGKIVDSRRAFAPGALLRQNAEDGVMNDRLSQKNLSAPMYTSELIAAIESLYQDELRPYGRILRKRLSERCEATGHGEADIDVQHLRSACISCACLQVHAEDGGDWSALLCGRESAFVDVYSPHDIYPQELWRAASAYFEALNDSKMLLPGGRYSCAQALVAEKCDFLLGWSLGQVCHIVQLAISQKKILGYLNGSIVPYGRSQSMVKERCAERQRPCARGANGTSTLAGWDAVRAGLLEILQDLKGSRSLPLSNIKRLFRARFHMDLSETALGHSKLSELFQDPRVQDICTVRLQGHGYVVAPKGKLASSQPVSQQSVPQQPAQSQSMVFHMQMPAQPQVMHHPQFMQCAQPLQLIQFLPVGNLYPCNTNAVAVAPAVPPTQMQTYPLPTAPREGSFRDRARCTQLCLDEIVTSGLPPTQQELGARSTLESKLEPCASRNLPARDVRTPSPQSQRQEEAPLPRLLGNLHARRAQFSKQTKLVALSDHTSMANPEDWHVPPTPEAWPVLLTPGALGNLRSSVQNTFVHVAAPPATPIIGALCRSHSLPRNMGSKDVSCLVSGPHDVA